MGRAQNRRATALPADNPARFLVRRWLADPNWAALGSRTLVRPFGTHGVQWNPADDYCVAAIVTIDRTPGDGPRWQLSGELAWAAPVS